MIETHEKPVVDPVKMPKIKIEKQKFAALNAWSIALAMFLGYSAIFAAISGFTKKWIFSIPFFGRFMGTNVAAPTSLLTALFALALAIFGIVTISKITDSDATKKAWGCISKVFLGFVVVYVVDMLGIIIYSLMSLGRTGFNQGDLWLSSFLSTFICCVGALAIWFMGRQIAAGKISVLRVASIVAIALAVIGFIIVFVQLMVSYYGKSSVTTPSYNDYDFSDIYDMIR